MSSAGRASPVSRKRPLVAVHALPGARSGGGEVGGSGRPKAKRRLFAADPGSRSNVAITAAAAEAELEEEKRLWREMTVRMEAERQRYMTELQRIVQYMQSLGESTHLATTPNESAASNNGPHDPPESSWPAW